MDENIATQAPSEPSTPEDTTPVDEGSTPEPQQQPDSSANDSDTTQEPPSQNEPQIDPNQTPDEDVPDRGVEPDEGIDPDGGDEPQKTDETKGMTRAERAAYYGEVEQQQREQVERAVAQHYAPQEVAELQEQYMQAGYTEGEALMLARDDVKEQRAQIAEATAQITQLNANLQVDAVEARAKYDWMNPDSKTFDKDTTQIAAQMFELATIKDERTGQIVDAKMTPSQVAGIVNQIRETAMKEAGLKARRAAEREMASVAPPTSNTNKRDPRFEELSPDQMREQLLARGHVF